MNGGAHHVVFGRVRRGFHLSTNAETGARNRPPAPRMDNERGEAAVQENDSFVRHECADYARHGRQRASGRQIVSDSFLGLTPRIRSLSTHGEERRGSYRAGRDTVT